jgi:hypothetical protein
MKKSYIMLAAVGIIAYLWYVNYGPGTPAATS